MARFLIQTSDRSLLAEVAYGVSPGAAASGWLANQLIQAARSIYDPIAGNASRAIKNILIQLGDAVENKVGETVYVYGVSPGARNKDAREWLGMDKATRGGYRAMVITLEPRLPSDDVALGQFHADMAARGMESVRRGMEKGLKINQPEEETEQVLIERFVQREDIQDLLAKDAAQAAGLIPIIDSAVETEELIQQERQ